MKYNLLLNLVLLFSFTASYGQYYEDKSEFVEVGKPYPVIDAIDKFYFHHKGEILTVKVAGKSIYLQKMNADNLSFIQVREYKDMPKHYEVEDVREFNGRIYLFYSDWDGAKELEQLFAREIDFAGGTFIGEGKKIVEVEGKIAGSLTRGGMWSFSVTDKFDFQRSFNGSKLLVQYRMRPEKKRDAINHDVIGMSVFDKDMNQLWKKEVEMPYTEKKMNNLDYAIDADGNTYILAKVFNDDSTDDKKKKKGDANYHIELLRIKANSSEIVSSKVTLKDKFISELALFEGPASYMTCAGFYNKGDEADDASGIMMFKVNAQGDIFDMKSYEIPLEILNLHAKRREQRKNAKEEAKGKAEFENLDLTELIVNKDGSILLIGEQYEVQTHVHRSSNGAMTTTYTYHYDDLLVTKINQDGSFAWMKKLPKMQKGGAGMGGMSYRHFAGDQHHYLVFLDNTKNLELPLDAVPDLHIDGKGGFLTAYKVNNKTGETTKISLLDTRDVKGMEVYQFMTSRIVPLALGHEFVFEVYKKKKEDILIKVAIID